MEHFWIDDESLRVVQQYLAETQTYDEYFDACMKKFNIESPKELSVEKRKEFFDYVDAHWDSEDQEQDKQE